MEALQARYFDGIQREGYSVLVRIDGHEILIDRVADSEVELRGLRVPLKGSRFLNTPADRAQTLLLPGGAYLKIDPESGATLRAALSQKLPLLQSVILRLERSRRFIVIGSAAAALFVILFFTVLLPTGSRWVSAWVPDRIAIRLGEEALGFIHRALVLRPSELPEETRLEIQRDFRRLVDGLETDLPYRLHILRSRLLGANAFALPSGDIVLLDDLVELAEHPDEILAVLAHEIGHVEMRHGLQMLINQSVTAFIFGTVLGDVSSISALAVALPTLLIESGYSRTFEFEADAYARDLMIKHGIALHHFPNILRRLTDHEDDHGSVMNYLSTHPPTQERVRIFEVE